MYIYTIIYTVPPRTHKTMDAKHAFESKFTRGRDPWERKPLGPKGSHGRGSRIPHGRKTLGNPRDPMGGDPWGPIGNPFKCIL